MKIKVSSKDFLSPLNYSVFILDLPLLKYEELKQAALFKIKKLYPGDIESIEIFIIKNGKKKHSYIVLAINKTCLKESKLLPFLLLYNKFRNKNCVAIFKSDEYSEQIIFNKGCIENYSLTITNNDEIDSTNCYFDFSYGKTSMINTRMAKIEYIPKNTNNKRLIILISILFLACCLCTYNFTTSVHYKKINEERKIEAKKKQQEVELKEKIISVENLSKKYVEIKKDETELIMNTLKFICDNFSSTTKIYVLDINGNEFNFEAISSDSLDILRKFETSEHIEKAVIHQVKPVNNKERYFMSGKVKYDYDLVSKDMSIFEQEKWLNINLQKEYDKKMKLNNISVSSLTEYIRNLIVEYGGRLQNYQYIKANLNNELEFSFYTRSSNIFSLLSILSHEEQLFKIKGLHIKTGTKDGINIILRIKIGEYGDNTENYVDFIKQYEIKPNFSIANYVSNFFNFEAFKDVTEVKKIIKSSEAPIVYDLPSVYKFVSMIGSDNNKIIYMKNDASGKLIKFSFSDKYENYTFSYDEFGYVILVIDSKKYKLEL